MKSTVGSVDKNYLELFYNYLKTASNKCYFSTPYVCTIVSKISKNFLY